MKGKIICLAAVMAAVLAMVARVAAGPGAARYFDQIESYAACNLTAEILASASNVYINGLPAALMGDSLGNETYSGCISVTNFQGRITTGSSSVYINGRPAVRDGDSCEVSYHYTILFVDGDEQAAGVVTTSSGDVFIGP
jgi:uncharacterized Zn-binding protein involved in type VI secretion